MHGVGATVSYLDRIPVFASEGILRSLLEPFLAFRKTFIPVAHVNISDAGSNRSVAATHFPTAMIAVSR